MSPEKLSFLSHYLKDAVAESKKKAKIRASITDLKSFQNLDIHERRFYEELAEKLDRDFGLDPEEYLKF